MARLIDATPFVVVMLIVQVPLIADPTTRPATTSVSFPVAMARLPDDRKPSAWESDLDTLSALQTRVLDAEERAVAVPQIRPWVQRVVALAYWPDWDAVKWGIVVDQELGDVFVGDYRVAKTSIHLVDTSTYLLMEFRDPQLGLPDEAHAADGWISRVRQYCQQADAIVQPPKLWVGMASDAMYCVPRYLDFPRSNEPVGWRRLMQFKLARGYFSFAAVKLIDGDSRTDIPFGIRTRVQVYADVVAGWKKEEMLAQLKKINMHELPVVLKHWNTREVSPAEMFEHFAGTRGAPLRSMLGDIQARTPAGAAEQALFEKVVAMINDGRIGPHDVPNAMFGLRAGDRQTLRRSVGAIEDAELRSKALETIEQ